MKRLVKGALLVTGTALAISVAPAIPAVAAASGSETFSGTIVFAAVPGTNTRTVVSSVVVAKGMFRGVGRFAELVPADSAGVSRDDLLFPKGTLHLVNTLVPESLSFSVNPHSCLFTGTVSGRALLARNPDGSCSLTQTPLHEVDKFVESGTLSF